MTSSNTDSEKISLNFFIEAIKSWILFLISKIQFVMIGTIAILYLTISFNYLINPIYFARTTFVLDNENSNGSIAELSSIASLAGINPSTFLDASSLFQIDNIQELYKSNSMIKKTLLSSSSFEGKDFLILDRFVKSEKLEKKWNKLGVQISDFRSNKKSRVKDSLLKDLVRVIKEDHLIVNKPSRKTTILEIGFDHKDEVLAKTFNENLVSIVNKFFQETKTFKTGANLKTIQRQADSVKTELDASLMILAMTEQNIPNPNPLSKTNLVPYQKALINTEVNGAIYQEILKQVELAKISHRNNMPLIQIIDKPEYPLENSKWKFIKTLINGFIFGFTLSIIFLSLKRTSITL